MLFGRNRPHSERRREEQSFLDRIKHAAGEVVGPCAAECDRNRTFPWRSVEVLNEIGLNAAYIPREYGGLGLSFPVFIDAIKIVSEACSSTGVVFATSFNAVQPIIGFGSEELKRRYLPRIAAGAIAAIAVTELDAGSDATAMRTSFTPQDSDIVINGHKKFVNSGDVADVLVVFGKHAEIADPKQSISAVVLERGAPGLELAGLEDKMGHRGASTVSFLLSGCAVPASALLGQPGDGIPMLLASFNRSRPSMAAQALGIAHAAFSEMVAYMNRRDSSGARPVDLQSNQFLLADAAAELALVDAWLDELAAMVDAGVEDFSIAASIAKLRASDAAMYIAAQAVDVLGIDALSSDCRAGRIMRDAKATQIWEGTNQIHRQTIGRSFAER